MLVIISRDRLERLLQQQIKHWEGVGDGPNLNAFSFNPKETDPEKLKELGYYDNKESWNSGVYIKALVEYLKELSELSEYTGKG